VSAGPRDFDPRRVGRLECAAWVAYYRRDPLRLLIAATGLVRVMFALPWPATLYGSWLVARGNQLWAPPDGRNDPSGATRVMERFYALVRRHHAGNFDPARAAALEVEWWSVHRLGDAPDGLTRAIAALYAYLYGVAPACVEPAARERALAMGTCDRWIAEGLPTGSPLIAETRAALVRSYAALLAAVHR
jgi:hypothetical protein